MNIPAMRRVATLAVAATLLGGCATMTGTGNDKSGGGYAGELVAALEQAVAQAAGRSSERAR